MDFLIKGNGLAISIPLDANSVEVAKLLVGLIYLRSPVVILDKTLEIVTHLKKLLNVT